MAFLVKATIQAVHSYLLSSGYVTEAQVGEPKAPPKTGLAAAVYMNRVSVASLTLSKTIELHVLTLRLYRDMLVEPLDEIEFTLAEAVSKIMEDLLGEYDLGATIRHVDAGGIYGTSVGATWGYIDVGGTLFRTVDITLPLVVDDSATLAA